MAKASQPEDSAAPISAPDPIPAPFYPAARPAKEDARNALNDLRSALQSVKSMHGALFARKHRIQKSIKTVKIRWGVAPAILGCINVECPKLLSEDDE